MIGAFDTLAKRHLAPDLEPPPMERLGSAILGKSVFGRLPYRNLLRVGSSEMGLVLALGARQLLIPWNLVLGAKAPWGIFPREKWLLGEEQIPLVVPRGTVQPPRSSAGVTRSLDRHPQQRPV